jgi:CPA2 family monovalent cation:H+ antiporter-2
MNAGGGDEAVAQQPAGEQAPAAAPTPTTPTSARAGAGAEPADKRHVVIIGFGLAGRAAVNNVIELGVSYTVIESNPDVVNRCLPGGLHIIHGDAREAIVLRLAGITRATDVAVTIPEDEAALAVVEQARKLNPAARIIARCTFVSDGLEATQRGADETVVAEQVVATEFGRVVHAALER